MSKTHNPMRVFEGSAKPHEPFWRFRDAVEGTEPELELYGYISEYSWYEDDITPRMFKDDLNKHGAGGPVTIRMNSYGGDVVAASVMSTIIRDYPGRVTVLIDGVAASAATVVAIAGDVVQMQETAYFMIHDPAVVFFMAMLNIDELTKLANSLQSVKEGIVNAYETRTGLSRTRLSKLMSDETWMDARRAVDLGFADGIIRAEKPIPVDLGQNAAIVNALRNYVNVPDALKMDGNVPTEPETSEPVMTDDMRREAQSLRDRVQTILGKEHDNA